MALLCLSFLGPLALFDEDQLLPLPATQKSQSLLAYLVMHCHRTQRRARLAGMFWPDVPEARARRNLNTALWQIRRVLPSGDYLFTSAQEVQFNSRSAYWLDVAEFESLLSSLPPGGTENPAQLVRLQQAVSLYRGDFLAGFYDDWVIEERYRLEAAFLEALARLALACQREGKYADALNYAQQLLHYDSLREDIHRLVIYLHLTLGDTVAAVRQCNRCLTLLKAELGVEPSPETLALCRPLFHGPWPTGEEMDIGPTVRPSPRQASLQVPPLVGRDHELGLLLAAWQEAVAGHGRTILVSGEAGVGKTRLVTELAQSTGWRDGLALWGCCYEYPGSLPYQPLTEALEAGLRFVPRLRLEALSPWMLAEVSWLVPALRQRCPDLPPPAPLAPAHAQARLFIALTDFLAVMSAQMPLLLVLEDLHWAGEPMLAFFHYLARHLGDKRLLLVGTYRHEYITAEHPLVGIARELSRERLLSDIRLDRLSAEAVTHFIGALTDLEDRGVSLAQHLYQATGGNPFFLIETLRALAESGNLDAGTKIDALTLPIPPSVRALILDRAARITPEARDLLNLAAVAGREFDLDLLEAAWGRGEEATLQALDDLLRYHLVRENPGQRDYIFDHDLICEVVYQALHHHRRRHLHRLVGHALQQLADKLPRPPVSALAYHFYHGRGHDPTLAARYGLEAGDQALSHYARREALHWYRQSRTLLDDAGLTPASAPPLAEIYTRLCLGKGNVLFLLGERESAEAALQEGLRWANALGDRAARADLLCALGRTALEAGDFVVTKDYFRQAATQYQALQDRTGLAEALHRLARTAYDAGDDPAETETLSQQVLALSQEIDDLNQGGLARWALGRIHYRRAQFAAADAYYGRALDCFRQVGNREDEGWTHLLWGLVYGMRYELAEAAAHFEASEAIFRDLEQPLGIGASLTQRGMVYLRRGELDQAQALWGQALDIFRTLGSRWEQAAVLWRLGLSAYQRGALDEALTHLSEGGALAQAIRHRELCLLIHLTAGDVHAAAGDWPAAEAAYSDALALGRATDDRRFLPRICCGLAGVALARGDAVGAGQWLREGRTLAASEDVEAQGMLFRLAGEVAAAQGLLEDALALLRRSVAILSGPPVPFELARSQHALACLETRHL